MSNRLSLSLLLAGSLCASSQAQRISPIWGFVPLPPLRTVGNQIQTTTGNQKVLLRGANCASMEWTADGEGHILTSVATAINVWKCNIIRLPLSQDRWFGHTSGQTDGGLAYRGLVSQVVSLCIANHCYILLDLHWSDGGVWGSAIGQHKMPDPNSLTFWTSCATTYKNVSSVIFDLYNEPHDVTWDVWLSGGSVTDTTNNVTHTYQSPGMQQMLNTIRATGALNAVVCGGLNWAYDFSGILAGRQLIDSQGNGVIYANHNYPFKGDSVATWQSKIEQAGAVLPVIVSEWGSDQSGGAGLTGDQWVTQVLGILKNDSYSFTAWDFHPAASPCLISDWSYRPTSWFGVHVLAALTGH